MSRDGHLLRSNHFHPYFRWMRLGFFKKAFHYRVQLLTFYLLCWNYSLFLKLITEVFPHKRTANGKIISFASCFTQILQIWRQAERDPPNYFCRLTKLCFVTKLREWKVFIWLFWLFKKEKKLHYLWRPWRREHLHRSRQLGIDPRHSRECWAGQSLAVTPPDQYLNVQSINQY